METTHRVVKGDARSMDELAANSVELVVTSPPYPMIEMWDDQFNRLNPDVGDHLAAGDGQAAFEAMHTHLDTVWAEVDRVLVDGGIACINVGDATRTLDGRFRVYPNHARVLEAFTELGFDPLPGILWRKPTNSAAKFMGSGMLPPNAYVTLEHEHVLVLRNGGQSRSFEPGVGRRYEAAYFWEERNRWFSDVWTDLTGERQPLVGEAEAVRERSGAYPFAVPYRLVNMYSVYNDTVLDPFLGTGTTILAAMVAGRHSVGYELESEFAALVDRRVDDIGRRSRRIVEHRLRRHREFVDRRRTEGTPPTHTATHYDFPLTSQQVRDIRLYVIDHIESTEAGYTVTHEPVTAADSLAAMPSNAGEKQSDPFEG